MTDYTSWLREVGLDIILRNAIIGGSNESFVLDAIVPRQPDGRPEIGVLYRIGRWSDEESFVIQTGCLLLKGFTYELTDTQQQIINKIFKDAFE